LGGLTNFGKLLSFTILVLVATRAGMNREIDAMSPMDSGRVAAADVISGGMMEARTWGTSGSMAKGTGVSIFGGIESRLFGSH
jgi:hypothetical protein